MATILVEILGSAKQFKGELEGAVVATEKANNGFAKMAKFAAVAGLAVAGGVAYGLTKSVEAAEAAEQATARMNAAFAASHVSAKAFAGGIDEAESKARKLGFTNEDVRGSLGSLIIATHDGHKAISDLAVAQDIARFKGVSLGSATKLLTMAMSGSQRATKQLGIDVPKVTTAQDALSASTKDHSSALYKNELAHAKIIDKLATENAVIATVTAKLHGQADAYSGTAAGAMARFHAQIDNIEEKVGTAFLPVLIKVTDWLTNHLPAAVGVAKSVIATLTPIIARVSAVISDLADKSLPTIKTAIETAFRDGVAIVKTFVSAIQNVVTWMQQNRDIVLAVGAAVATAGAGLLLYEGYQLAVAAATKIATIAQLAFNLVMDANPVALVVLAIAALVGGLVLLYERSATARTIMDGAFKDIKIAADAAFSWLATTALPAVQHAFQVVAPIVVSAVGDIVNVIKGFVSQVRQNWGTITSIIVPPIEAAWNQVQLVFNTAKTTILNIVDGFKNLLEGHWGAAWGNLKAIVAAQLGFITGTLSNLFQGISATAGRLALAVAQVIGDNIKKAPSFLLGLAGDMINKITADVNQLSTWALNAFEAVGAAIAGGIKHGFQAAYADLSATVDSLTFGLLGDAKKKIKAHSPSELWADEIGKPMADGIAVGFLLGTGSLPATISQGLQTAIEAGRTVIQAAQSTFQTVWSRMASDADAAFGKIKGAIQTPAEKALADLQGKHDTAGRTQALTDAQTALTTAQAGGDPAAILAAQQQLADAQYAIQVAALQKQADAQRVQLDARNALQQRNFDDALAALQAHLAKGHTTYAEAHAEILKLFKSFGINYSAAGADLGRAFVTGLKESIQSAASKSGSLAGKLADVAAGIKIPHAATGGFVEQTGLAVIHQGETITPAGQGGNTIINITGIVGDEQIEQIRNILIRTGRRTSGGVLGGF